MELLHEFSFVVMPLMVCISALAGRLSLLPKHFTGWYETFHDIKTLTSLILCSTLFFVSSVLLAVLLIFSPQPRCYFENAKNGVIIFLVYLVAVVGLFCLPPLKDRRKRRRQKKLLGKGSNSAVPGGAGGSAPSVDVGEQAGASEAVDTSGDISVTKDILQFLCKFSIAFCIQLFLLVLLLYGCRLKATGNWPSDFWTLLLSGPLNVIGTYNCDLFILVFLLALTSCTGGLLAAIGVDYRKDSEEALTFRIRNRSRNNLDKLVKLIRSR